MPKFAVYFVPKSDESFYQFGSQILGYDLRARRSVRMSSSLEQELGKIEDARVEYALGQGTGYSREFITGARTFDEARSRKIRVFYSQSTP